MIKKLKNLNLKKKKDREKRGVGIGAGELGIHRLSPLFTTYIKQKWLTKLN